MKKLQATALFLLGTVFPAAAQETGNVAVDTFPEDDAIAIYGSACENISGGEAKSTARVRVTDKASFQAVSALDAVKDYKNDLNEHDFNVFVYNLVDNYIEDMAVRTTKQDNASICVEVTGYLQKANIFPAVNALLEETEAASASAEKQSMSEIVDEVNKEFSLQPNAPKEQGAFIQPTSEEELEKYKVPPAPAKAEDDKKALVYIAPTEFFDNSRSEKHAGILKNLFARNEYLYVTDKEDLADYVVSSKVLRAKIDPINSSTSRLQMVVAVGVRNVEEKSEMTEHQNRFVVFSEGEKEQDVAYKLMKKLFEKAGGVILDRIEQTERKKAPRDKLPPIITPADSAA